MPAVDSTVAIAVLDLVLAAALVVVLALRNPTIGTALGIAVAIAVVLLTGGMLWGQSSQADSDKVQKDVATLRSDFETAKKKISERLDRVEADVKKPPEAPKPPSGASPAHQMRRSPERESPPLGRRSAYLGLWRSPFAERSGE